MVKTDLVRELSGFGYNQEEMLTAINDIFYVIGSALARGERVKIKGFGNFEIKTHKGHLIMDTFSKEHKVIDDYKVVSFKPGDNLRAAIKTGDPDNLFLLAKGSKEE